MKALKHKNAPELRFGLDLGGTKIEGAILDKKGRVTFRKRVDTNQEEGYETILKNLALLYDQMKKDAGGKYHTLGIGTPGAISLRTGKLKNSNTVCLNGRLSLKILERLFKRPLTIENDANCFAMAEALLGAGRGYQRVFGVIIGTGCGGGIVERGAMIKGLQGIAGEWGHMAIDPKGPACYCGSRGCVETFISGGGLEKLYRNQYKKALPLPEIVAAFRMKDRRAMKFMGHFFRNFGRSMANLINVLDPDVVVLGGGVSNIVELYTAGVHEVKKQVFGDDFRTPIVKHQLGDSAGVIGAALLGK